MYPFYLVYTWATHKLAKNAIFRQAKLRLHPKNYWIKIARTVYFANIKRPLVRIQVPHVKPTNRWLAACMNRTVRLVKISLTPERFLKDVKCCIYFLHFLNILNRFLGDSKWTCPGCRSHASNAACVE